MLLLPKWSWETLLWNFLKSIAVSTEAEESIKDSKLRVVRHRMSPASVDQDLFSVSVFLSLPTVRSSGCCLCDVVLETATGRIICGRQEATGKVCSQFVFYFVFSERLMNSRGMSFLACRSWCCSWMSRSFLWFPPLETVSFGSIVQ